MRSLATLFMTRPLHLSTLGSLVAYYGLLASQLTTRSAHGMFAERSSRIPFSTRQLNYGVAVTDVDGDGEMEWVVAGFSGPNLVLKLDKASGYYYNLATEDDDRFQALRDVQGQAIGVCACDIDGDGREEIYFLNTNDRYSGAKTYKDKLFKWRRGADGRERYENLFDDPGNDAALSMFAGRSVAAVDRKGNGKYGIILATYAQYGQGSFGLIEMNETASDVNRGRIVLQNAAREAGIAMSTGGRGITVGPIVGSDGHSDIFFDNEGGFRGNDPNNALFVNNGHGHFTNRAEELGLDDSFPGRGVALADFNNNGRLDIVYGNWMHPHKLMLQQQNGTFVNVASPEMSAPSPIRTVIATDFDNDGSLDVFYNNIVYQRGSSPQTWENRLFRVVPDNRGGVSITRTEVGDAVEPDGYGTGGAVADMDGDGRLELLLSHGESNPQDLSLFHVVPGQGNHWLRIMPLTRYNAPARGAKVTLTLRNGTRLTRVVDGGSGYLCQMEPVAHFGLGELTAVNLMIQWPDGSVLNRPLGPEDQNRLHRVPFSRGAPPRGEGGEGGGRGRPSDRLVYQHMGQDGSRTGGAGGVSSHADQNNRRAGMQSPNRGGSAGSPNRRTGAESSSYRRPNAGIPISGGSRTSVNNNEDRFSRRTGSVSPNRGSGESSNSRGGISSPNRGRTPSVGSASRRGDRGGEGSCRTTRVQQYVRDDSTDCYSARPIRMSQCNGGCTSGNSCCRPRQDRFRRILFACRNGHRYRKVYKAGVRRCRCVPCGA